MNENLGWLIFIVFSLVLLWIPISIGLKAVL